ncbi:hypothetical protein [Haloplanus rubicundus]|uniref:hypothetical protein n=1 Tax=Haloplanus rubicundus TaxID=1547898 RepID=UPI0013007B24|nr:hypothetical protein [Haloplanus rubicundus]
MSEELEEVIASSGSTVTRDRLTGHATYYPPIETHIENGLIPFHIALLTHNWDLDIFHGGHSEDYTKYMEVSTRDVALVAGHDVVAVINESTIAVALPYEMISSVWTDESGNSRRVEVRDTYHSMSFQHAEAKSAPSNQFDETIRYIRSRISN